MGINLTRFQKDFFYKYKNVWKFRKIEFEVIFCPISSRLILLTDRLVYLCISKNKIAYENTDEDYFGFEIQIRDNYSVQIPFSNKNQDMFEFKRNSYFAGELIEEKVDLKEPYIKLEKINDKPDFPYILIFPAYVKSIECGHLIIFQN